MRRSIAVTVLFASAASCDAPGVVGERGSSPETCEVPTMDALYPGPLAPNPDEDRPDAGACIQGKHDVIVVLGCPTDADGSPSECQRTRAGIAIALHASGRGDHFIVSGAAVHNAFSESQALFDLLVARGIAADSIVREPRAEHTDENLYWSSRIMRDRGWRSALVVSDSAGQLLYNALCDSNCCVALGRLTVVDLDGVAVGHYVLYPDAAPVTRDECDVIEDPRMGVCVNLGTRRACKDHFEL
jgi:hypothetical protein